MLRPVIGGTKAVEPVAITILRALTARLALSTVSRLSNAACSRTTRTPRPSKRSWLSTGAIVAMVRATWAITSEKLTSTPEHFTPRAPAARMAEASAAAAIMAFEGTQP